VSTSVEYLLKCFSPGKFLPEGDGAKSKKREIHNCGINLWTIMRAGKIYLEI